MKPLRILVALILIISIFTAGVLSALEGKKKSSSSHLILNDVIEEDFEEINEFSSPQIWSDRHGITFKNSTSQNISTDLDQRGDIDLCWEDNRRGDWNIYYVKIDNKDGEKLINDFRVSDNGKRSLNPKVISYLNQIYIVWEERTNGDWDLYFSKLRYSAEEVTTLIERKLITSLGRAGPKNYTFVRGRDTQFHLLYEKEKNGAQNIFYRRINGEGENIISPFQITDTSSPSRDPKLKLTEDGKLHLLWLEPIEDNNGIFYTKIDYAGNTWVERKRLTVVNRLNRYDLARDEKGNLHLVFDDDRYHNYKRDVIYQKLSSKGKILIDDTLMTDRDDDSNSFLPTISRGKDGYLYISWSDSRDYRYLGDKKKNITDIPHDIYIKKIDLDGNIVKSSYRITGTFSYSADPIVITDRHNQQQLIWEDSRRDVMDIYHKKTLKPDLTVSDLKIEPKEPEFNSTVDVDVKIKNLGQSHINTTGRLYIGVDEDFLKEINISINAETTKTFKFNFTVMKKGIQKLSFVVNEGKNKIEKTYENNMITKEIFIRYYKLSLTPVTNHTAVNPGNSGSFSYNLTNDGNIPQEVEVSFKTPGSMKVDHDPIEEALKSGETKRFNFSVNSKGDQRAGEYVIKLIVSSLDKEGLNVTGNFTLKVKPAYDLSLSVEKKTVSNPGKMNYTVDITVTNLANTDQEVLVYVKEGSKYAFVEGGMMRLNPDEMGHAVLNLTKYRAIEGKDLEITLSAESMENNEVTESTNVTIKGANKVEEQSWIDIIPWFWIGIAAAVIVGILIAIRVYYTYIS